ncbi:hypothetical protein ACIQKB_04025 [Streptomyces sp. NPDC092046]|uniref:hypothetical protein n=1 Tax=Streptomyces sp. NPDC092046 TaxID=3366009 RepID=UPI003807C5EC
MKPNRRPYSGDNPRCKKCGNHGAYTRYHDGSDMRGERLGRQCSRCDYEWEEATVQEQPPTHTGGNAEDCPACQQQGSDMLAYPRLCPGPTT